MATTISSPARMLSPADRNASEALDDDIARVRVEIANLSKRRHVLSASLINSTKFQSQFWANSQKFSDVTASLPTETNPLVSSQRQHNETNIHRLALGITSFPFTDPNPETSNDPLLGIRFDIPSHTGTFDQAPYYLFCKRSPTRPGKGSIMSVHHHTIPALVPLQQYIDRYLPQPLTEASTLQSAVNDSDVDMDGDADEDPTESSRLRSSPPPASDNAAEPISSPFTTSPQDLHGLASAVYTDLKAWSIRRSSLEILRDRLGLSPSSSSIAAGQSNHSVRSIEPLSVDHNFLRLIWTHGMVGRLKISSDGFVDLALVYGRGKTSESEKLDHVGRALSRNREGERVRVVDLAERFAEVERIRMADAGVHSISIGTNGTTSDVDSGDNSLVSSTTAEYALK